MGRGRDLLTAGLLALLAGCARERPGLEPRHVLLLTVGHLRADRCSFLLHERPTTWLPSDELMRSEHRAFSFDDLAAEGVVFAHCYAPSPVLEVSLAALLAGRPPLETGVLRAGEPLPGELVTLAEAFRAGGFQTAAFVAGDPPLEPSFGAGFARFETHASDAQALAAMARHLGRDPGSGARHFTWVHLAGLAPPWSATEALPEILGERDFGLDGDAGPVDGSTASLRALNDGAVAAKTADREALRALYDRRLARLSAEAWLGLHAAFDFHTGAAEASETWARTVFVLAGLNGIELLDRGAVGTEGLLSEAVLHVPLVLRHPDSLTGERILAEIVGLEDVAPTLLDWLGLPPLPGARGRSLLALTDSYVQRPFPPRPAFAQLPDRAVFSARDARFRLVWNPTGARPAGRPAAAGPLAAVELFDLAADPRGVRDASASHPEAVARLSAEIRAWRESLGARPAARPPATR
ncbi:MAG: sulfatase-like hydrolase/transferase [Planctomycetes bacterium]|nr:sulfatase-like hydrolase/transferase [Planctomycetota bacterium]